MKKFNKDGNCKIFYEIGQEVFYAGRSWQKKDLNKIYKGKISDIKVTLAECSQKIILKTNKEIEEFEKEDHIVLDIEYGIDNYHLRIVFENIFTNTQDLLQHFEDTVNDLEELLNNVMHNLNWNDNYYNKINNLKKSNNSV